MPDLDGFSVVQALKADPDVHHIPVIMMTARSELASRVQGLDLGAHDYVSKPFETAELVARIRAALRVKQLQDALMHANRKLEQLATSDPLTELPNRRTFDEQFFLAIERSRRSGEPVSVMMIDLDDFKRINDELGHHVGDAALTAVGAAIAARVRPYDTAARVGGEEFLIVMPNTREDEARVVVDRLREGVLSVALRVPALDRAITCSAGIAVLDPAYPENSHALYVRADSALLEAKGTGKNRSTVHRERARVPAPLLEAAEALARPIV